MAKRVSPDEKPFRPLEDSLIRSVIQGRTGAAQDVEPGEGTKVAPATPRAEVATVPNPARTLTLAEEAPPPMLGPSRQPPAGRQSPTRGREAPVAVLSERMDREKRVLLSRSEEAALDRAVARMGTELGTSLKLSHVLRACVSLVLHSEDELVQRARQSPKLIRPANGDSPSLAVFERGVAQVLLSAFRDARQVR